MSAPPLPDVFGNYALHDFVEIVPPESISWLPQTAGWRWLGAVLLVFALRYLWRRLRHWYHNRYRREAIKRLRALSSQSTSADFLADINRLLKITALVAYSREYVARLSGENWVNFLNQQCDQPPFNPEQAVLLARTAYRQQPLEPAQQRQLVAAGLAWISQHRGRQHV